MSYIDVTYHGYQVAPQVALNGGVAELAARLLREAIRARVQLLAGGEEEAAVGERESRRAEVRVESVFGDVPALGHVRHAVHDAHQVVVGDLAGDVLAAAEPVRENGEDAVSADEY